MCPAIPHALACALCPANDYPGIGPKAQVEMDDSDSARVFMTCDKAVLYLNKGNQGLQVAHAKLPCATATEFDLYVGKSFPESNRVVNVSTRA